MLALAPLSHIARALERAGRVADAPLYHRIRDQLFRLRGLRRPFCGALRAARDRFARAGDNGPPSRRPRARGVVAVVGTQQGQRPVGGGGPGRHPDNEVCRVCEDAVAGARRLQGLPRALNAAGPRREAGVAVAARGRVARAARILLFRAAF